MTRHDFDRLIRSANLGAQGEEGCAIGDCISSAWNAWNARPRFDIDIPDDLAGYLEAALDELNACYDDNGYIINGSAAHAAEYPVCEALEAIEAAVYHARGED